MRMAQGARGMAHGTQRKDKRVRFEVWGKVKQALGERFLSGVRRQVYNGIKFQPGKLLYLLWAGAISVVTVSTQQGGKLWYNLLPCKMKYPV